MSEAWWRTCMVSFIIFSLLRVHCLHRRKKCLITKVITIYYLCPVFPVGPCRVILPTSLR
ncbi:hypothetical protein EV421DRAFT_1868300 [Armillaria borealis]|uniref:Uncharacterized protein n=1 Tax=Armillaria borealis TaxID=47425 RepID=A0AA39IF01_9AGAR|nr:hypothetical protein EV421DRAFT_1868300 [Armillaria borealis]